MDLRNNLGRALRGAAVLILLLNITVANAQCQTNFVRVHNKCYFFSKDVLQWRDAYYQCSDMGSTMLVLQNKSQDIRFHRYLRKGYLIPTEWWMGASYDWKQRSWKWAPAGHVLKYNRFEKTGPKQDLQWSCAILDPTVNYKWWNSRKCTDKKHYVCQKDLEPTSAPSKEDLPTISSPFYAHKQDNSLKSNSAEPAYIKTRPVRTKSKYDPSKPKYLCPKGYRHIRQKCYKFSTDEASWQKAYFTCDEEYNGTLAIVRDRREDKALRRTFRRMGLNNDERWIGGRYDWEDMAWKWARDGTIIQHQSYDRELLRWHCLIWSPLIKDKWSSDNCMKTKHYICQTKATLVQFPKGYKSLPQQRNHKKLRPMKVGMPSYILHNRDA